MNALAHRCRTVLFAAGYVQAFDALYAMVSVTNNQHTCTSMIHDGERCPNFVARPDKFRICTTGCQSFSFNPNLSPPPSPLLPPLT